MLPTNQLLVGMTRSTACTYLLALEDDLGGYGVVERVVAGVCRRRRSVVVSFHRQRRRLGGEQQDGVDHLLNEPLAAKLA